MINNLRNYDKQMSNLFYSAMEPHYKICEILRWYCDKHDSPYLKEFVDSLSGEMVDHMELLANCMVEWFKEYELRNNVSAGV